MNVIITKIEKRVKRIVLDVFWHQKKISYGEENPEKVFYVIRRASKVQGLFSYVFTHLSRIDEAIKSGYIPIIDMMNYKNSFLEESKVGKENAWEYFFEQPYGIGIDEIKYSKNIILSNGGTPAFIPNTTEEFLKDEEIFNYWKELMRKYVRLNGSMQDYVANRRKELIPEGSRVLGVLSRGTDYTATKPYMHPIQPEVEDLIEKSKEIMEKYECEYLFLATEDESIYRKFYGAFSGKLITNQSIRYENTGKKLINEMHNERDNDRFLTGRDYLTSIIILSQCNCLVAGKTSGSLAALLFSDGYEFSYLYNLGFYGKKKDEKWNIRG